MLTCPVKASIRNMTSIQLTFNPKKNLDRKDVIAMGKMLAKAAADKKVDSMVITVTDDMKGGANSMAFPFRIVDEK